MSSWPPAVADFKSYFVREFIYSDGPDAVMDPDITRALAEAGDGSFFSQGNWDTVAQRTTAYLYLAAHLLWENINMAGGLSAVPRGRGIRDYGEGTTASKGVGGANHNFVDPPDRIKSSPTLMRFWRSTFGMRYVQMVAPRLIGNFAVVAGPNDLFGPALNNPV